MADPQNNFDSDGNSPLTLSGKYSFQVDDAATVFQKSAEILTVIDVYSIASSVGREFERLTDAFGGAIFVGVMPKIIRILEMLEDLVKKQDGKMDKITELTAAVQKLQLDSMLKDEKQQEEVEIVESAWKDETRGLLETVSTLEEDNRRLTALLTEKLEELEVNDNNNAQMFHDQQNVFVANLTEQMEKQRTEIKNKNKLLDENAQEIDALQSQITRMTKLNVDLRNKAALLEQQGKSLIEKQSELEARLFTKGNALTDLQMRSLRQEKNFCGTSSLETKHCATSVNSNDENWPGDPLMSNKQIIDLTDPNRPRYTLQELQEVLNDRNQLKARCFLLEEELIFHRGDEKWEELNDSEIKESRHYAEEHQEAKSAPTESGIRKFFSYLTGRHGNSKQITQKQQHHQVVESEEDSENLVNTGEVNQFLPGININSALHEQKEPSEMTTLSSNAEELDDLSP
ncbi:RILP-like protein 1 isoform X2 [Clavelina lepadiformis]|uniref:RILP-like protein 1 isoform X2 n=1 Tax=Clavelina lepadiformis TaxID=159417 RepID=UPI004041DF69